MPTYNPAVVTPIAGVNLFGNDTPNAGGDNAPVPRIQALSTVLLSGNRVAIYVQTKASVNPNTTVTLDTASVDGGGTVSATTGTGTYITLNSSTAGSAEWIWAYGISAP